MKDKTIEECQDSVIGQGAKVKVKNCSCGGKEVYIDDEYGKRKVHITKGIFEVLMVHDQETHETKDGWCCACGYDMAVFEDKIAQALSQYKDSLVKGLDEWFYKYATKEPDGTYTLVLTENHDWDKAKSDVIAIIKEGER